MNNLTIYQVNKLFYSATIPKIITKILKTKKKILLFCHDKYEMEYFDNLLWTFSQLSFIPHAVENDQFDIDLQDVLITIDINAQLFQDKHLIFLSHVLLSKIKLSINNDVFVIVKDVGEFDIQKLPNSVLLSRSVKYFKQSNDCSWSSVALSS